MAVHALQTPIFEEEHAASSARSAVDSDRTTVTLILRCPSTFDPPTHPASGDEAT